MLIKVTIALRFSVGIASAVLLVGCVSESPLVSNSGTASEIRFHLTLNRDEYIMTNWAEPPQFAIWLEHSQTGEIRTVWVTGDTGTDTWDGRVGCPVALPYWVSRYGVERGDGIGPTNRDPVPDALTGPTPAQEHECTVRIEEGEQWSYFVEVNVSGDFNEEFPQYFGFEEDRFGNGQPSIVYRGEIDHGTGVVTEAELIGRTEQEWSVSELNPDMSGITSANNLLIINLFKDNLFSL
jgi:hypothetical protein